MGLLIKIFSIAVAILLALHGLFHFSATAFYLKFGSSVNPAYKTTLLSGQWNVGTTGIAIFGVFWALTALAFILAAVQFALNRPYWKVLLFSSTLVSFLLIFLDWQQFYLGAIVNTAVLVFLGLSNKIVDAYRLPKNGNPK